MNGYLKIIAAAVIWGSIGVVVKMIELPVPVMAFYRVLFASMAIFLYILSQGKLRDLRVGRSIYKNIAIGVLLAANWTSFFYSIKLTSVANAVLLTYTSPILVAILAPFFLKERLERITIITLAIALVGIVLIASPTAAGFSPGDLAGIAWAGLSAVTYAIIVIISKPLIEKISVLSVLFINELVCAITLSPAFFLFDFSVDVTTLLILLVLGVFHTAFSAGLYLSGLREVKAQQAGVFTYIDPASAVVFAAIFLGEIPKTTTILGGLLIIASGVILVYVTRERIPAEVVSE